MLGARLDHPSIRPIARHMFLDSRQLPQDTLLEPDICIIGAGAAGITIARELMGGPYDVVLLEGGAMEMEPNTQSLYRGESVGLVYPELHTGRSRYFGGSTNCWGGWCRPLDEIDFAARAWVPDSGWPFGKAELAPYYQRAGEVCNVASDDFDPRSWAQKIAPLGLNLLPLEGDRVVTQISQVSGEPRFARAYGEAFKSATNIRVYLNATAVEIETSETAREVTGVRAATLAGNTFRAAARIYILAAGGIENARLLLASNRVQEAGLGNQHDLVGRYFMEHPRLHRGALVLNDPKDSIDVYDVQYTYFHSPIGANLALSPETQEAEGLLNYKTWILSVYHGEDARGGEALKNLYRAIRKTTMPDHFMETTAGFWLRNVGNVVLDFPHTAAVIYGRLSKAKWLVKKRVLANLCEAAPNPDSRVLLSDQRDPLGQHRARLDWRLSPLDKHTIRRAQEIIDEELRRNGIGRIETEPMGADDTDWPEDLSWGWHHMSTTRMHDDPKKGVVDRHCRVHGMSNLYIAGSSVFPTGGNDLPTMTIVALALRLVDHLKAAIAGEVAGS